MEDHIKKYNKKYKNHIDEPSIVKTEDNEDYTKMNIDGSDIVNEEGERRFSLRVSETSKILNHVVNPFSDSPYTIKLMFFCLVIATSIVIVIALASMLIKK